MIPFANTIPRITLAFLLIITSPRISFAEDGRSVHVMSFAGDGKSSHVHGKDYVPIIMLFSFGEGGLTEGLEVSLLAPERRPEAPSAFLDKVWQNIEENLCQPVKTDVNSTAVLWMVVPFTTTWSDDGTDHHRNIKGTETIVIGPQDEPFCKIKLAELLPDLKKAQTTSGPLFFHIDLKKYIETQALEDVEANATPPSTAPEESKSETKKTPKPESEKRPTVKQ